MQLYLKPHSLRLAEKALQKLDRNALKGLNSQKTPQNGKLQLKVPMV